MKTPPFLLGAALLFWGWQSGLLFVGALMGAVLESARWFKGRWEVSDEDFTRIWTFCSLLVTAAAVYAFTTNEAQAELRGFMQHPNFFTTRNFGNASARAAAAWLRWLPMLLFLCVAGQVFSSREGVPLEALSPLLRRRIKIARKLGRVPPRWRRIDVSVPYFGLCLFSASIHQGENASFFWGVSALMAWALWPRRSPRFHIALWGGAIAGAIGLAFFTQQGVGQLGRYLENINPQWLANWTRQRFDHTQSRTSLGYIGLRKTSPRIVIRLEAKNGPPPVLLRSASYRRYTTQTWYSETPENAFERVEEVPPNSGSFVLVPRRTNEAIASVACYLDGGKGLLPLPSGSDRLEHLADSFLRKSDLGAVLAEGPGLVIFDAYHGIGPTLDAPANTNQDLAVPPLETPALEQVIAEEQLNNLPLDEQMVRLRTFFQNKFTYRSWQEPGKFSSTNQTPLTRFLLGSRAGHCEYFATATVLLLRELGVPARYGVGFAVHEGSGKKYVVRERDAHAWCLVWDASAERWKDFDTTPGSWVEAEAKNGTPLEFVLDLWSWVGFQVSKVRWGQAQLRQYLLWSLIPVLVVLLYQILFRTRRQKHRPARDTAMPMTGWPGLDSEFYELEKRLAARGSVRQPGEPLSDWLRRVGTAPGVAELHESLKDLVRLHYKYRFDPVGLSNEDRQRLSSEAGECLKKLTTH
jgi:transglutaminase-like putative cysteine protease